MKRSLFAVALVASSVAGPIGVHAADRLDREGLIEPSMTVDLGSPVRGVLADVLVRRGDIVRKGAVVARLDARAEKAAVELAKARAAYTKRRMERNEDLYRQDLVSSQERDEMATESQLAALELRESEARLSMRTITSPINGVVVDRVRSPGEFVEDTEIVKLAQIDPLNIEVVVPVDYFGRITAGMDAEVTSQAPLSQTHGAKVTIVDRVIDAASSTFRVRLQIPNRRLAMPSGLRCQVRFPFDDEAVADGTSKRDATSEIADPS